MTASITDRVVGCHDWSGEVRAGYQSRIEWSRERAGEPMRPKLIGTATLPRDRKLARVVEEMYLRLSRDLRASHPMSSGSIQLCRIVISSGKENNGVFFGVGVYAEVVTHSIVASERVDPRLIWGVTGWDGLSGRELQLAVAEAERDMQGATIVRNEC